MVKKDEDGIQKLHIVGGRVSPSSAPSKLIVYNNRPSTFLKSPIQYFKKRDSWEVAHYEMTPKPKGNKLCQWCRHKKALIRARKLARFEKKAEEDFNREKARIEREAEILNRLIEIEAQKPYVQQVDISDKAHKVKKANKTKIKKYTEQKKYNVPKLKKSKEDKSEKYKVKEHKLKKYKEEKARIYTEPKLKTIKEPKPKKYKAAKEEIYKERKPKQYKETKFKKSLKREKYSKPKPDEDYKQYRHQEPIIEQKLVKRTQRRKEKKETKRDARAVEAKPMYSSRHVTCTAPQKKCCSLADKCSNFCYKLCCQICCCITFIFVIGLIIVFVI